MVIGNCYRDVGFFAFSQNDIPERFCHSERAFGRGRIPTNITSTKNVRFFAIARLPAGRLRMTFRRVLEFFVISQKDMLEWFCHSERAFGRGRIPYQHNSSTNNVGFFAMAQNDIPRRFYYILIILIPPLPAFGSFPPNLLIL